MRRITHALLALAFALSLAPLTAAADGHEGLKNAGKSIGQNAADDAKAQANAEKKGATDKANAEKSKATKKVDGEVSKSEKKANDSVDKAQKDANDKVDGAKKSLLKY